MKSLLVSIIYNNLMTENIGVPNEKNQIQLKTPSQTYILSGNRGAIVSL